MSSSSSCTSTHPSSIFDSRYLNRWKAERVNGNVQRPAASAAAAVVVDADGNHHLPPVTSASFLQRRTSVAGNILIFKNANASSSSSSEAESTIKAYLLQRKLGNVWHGSIRLGYLLEKPPPPPLNISSASLDLGGENNDMETMTSNSLEGLMWQVVVATSKKDHEKKEEGEEEAYEMVKIHIHNNNHHHHLLTAALNNSNSSSNDEQSFIDDHHNSSHDTEDNNNNNNMNGLAALCMIAEYYQQHAIPPSQQHVLGTDLVGMEQGKGGGEDTNNAHHRHVVYYSITPFYPDEMTLFDYLMTMSSSSGGRIPEAQARGLFRQIVKGLATLKTLGICHGQLSLTNVLIRDDESGSRKHVTLAGLGAGALCIPTTDADATAASTSPSLLIQPSNSSRCIAAVGCGTDPMYVAPEVFAGEQLAGASSSYFDGAAIDLWAASVMLFVMLVGMQQQQEEQSELLQDDNAAAAADSSQDEEASECHKRPRMNSTSGGGGGSSRSLMFAAPVPADWRFTEICVNGNLSQLLLDNNNSNSSSSSGGVDLSPAVVDLLQNLLHANPADRLTLEKVQSHPWLLQQDNE